MAILSVAATCKNETNAANYAQHKLAILILSKWHAFMAEGTIIDHLSK